MCQFLKNSLSVFLNRFHGTMFWTAYYSIHFWMAKGHFDSASTRFWNVAQRENVPNSERTSPTNILYRIKTYVYFGPLTSLNLGLVLQSFISFFFKNRVCSYEGKNHLACPCREIHFALIKTKESFRTFFFNWLYDSYLVLSVTPLQFSQHKNSSKKVSTFSQANLLKNWLVAFILQMFPRKGISQKLV